MRWKEHVSLGRPKHRWKQDIKVNITKTGNEVRQWGSEKRAFAKTIVHFGFY
jgi:hypothetical protein